MLEELAKMLKYFYKSSQMVQLEGEPSMSIVLVVYKRLQDALENIQIQTPNLDKLRKTMIKELKTMKINKLTSYHCIATILDPRFKSSSSGYIPREDYASSVAEIENHLAEVAQSVYRSQCSGEPKQKKKRRFTMCDSDDEEEEAGDNNVSDKALRELQAYISSPELEEDTDILSFWRAAPFTALKQVARSYLSIPATQTATERSFSAAGNTVSSLRCKMEPRHMNKLLVIRSAFKNNYNVL